MAHVRPSTVDDAHDLAPRLREIDVHECRAMNDQPPLEALLQGVLEGEECYSIIGDDGEIIGMFGIHHSPEYGDGQATVWMLASPSLVKIKREFIRQTGDYLHAFHQKYPLLWNMVDSENDLCIRWLRRVGFVFIKRHDNFGPYGRTFFEFVRIDPCAHP